jgi:hypothetical protein
LDKCAHFLLEQLDSAHNGMLKNVWYMSDSNIFGKCCCIRDFCGKPPSLMESFISKMEWWLHTVFRRRWLQTCWWTACPCWSITWRYLLYSSALGHAFQTIMRAAISVWIHWIPSDSEIPCWCEMTFMW